MEIEISQKLKEQFPGIQLVTLAVKNVVNKDYDSRLEKEKRLLEEFIKENYDEPKKIEQIGQYNEFFYRFGVGFPVEYQLASIVGGKEIPALSALVEAMFMTELKHCCLMAGHDMDLLEGNLILDLAKGGETYLKISEEEQVIKQGDIILCDQKGVVASVLYGPDSRTKITAATKNVIYMAYLIFPIERAKIIAIMADLRRYLTIAEGPHAQIEKLKIHN